MAISARSARAQTSDMIGGSSPFGHVAATGTMTCMDDPASDATPAGDLEWHDLRLRLWTRAHHEAAHAVVGTLLGGQVEAVEIWSGPPTAGRIRLAGLEDDVAGQDSY